MLAAAAKNSGHGDEMLGLLLSRPNKLPATANLIKSVIVHKHFGREMMGLLEKHYGSLDITDDVVNECAAHGRLPTIKYLQSYSKATSFSQETFERCTRTGNWDVAQYILRQNNDIRITQACIDAAAGNINDVNHIVHFLLREWDDGRVTAETLKQAMHADRYAVRSHPKPVKTLLQRSGITCLSADILMKVLPGLSPWLDTGLDLEISETLFVAAAKSSNMGVADESLRLLLSRNTHIQITEHILKAAAANLSLTETTLNALLSLRGAIGSITEEVQTSAALCGNLRFFKAMSHAEGIAQNGSQLGGSCLSTCSCAKRESRDRISAPAIHWHGGRHARSFGSNTSVHCCRKRS